MGGSSGEQEEDTSSSLINLGAGSGMMSSNFNQYGGSTFESGRGRNNL